MSSLLITGGAGFIGSNFVHHWSRRHPEDRIVVLDALTYAGNRASLTEQEGRPGFRFVHGDIRDRKLVESLLRDEQLDTIVHFAAESHVDRSIHGPGLFLDVNVNGTHSLLEAARRVWRQGGGESAHPHRFHHVSTDEVYGSLGPEDPAFNEESRYAPNSPYAASKAAADHLVRAYGRTYGLCTTISNCSNNYGPYHFPEKLIPLCIVRLLRGETLPIYGDGGNVRDWLHVEDHCRAIELVLAGGRPGETYNAGGDCERTNLQVVRSLCRSLDELMAREPELVRRFPRSPAALGETSESRIRFVPDRPGHDRRYGIDGAKIRAELGFRPRISLEQGLERTVRWYLEHPGWWQPLLDDDSWGDWIRRQYGDG